MATKKRQAEPAPEERWYDLAEVRERLDREAEMNHQRESRSQPTKVFKPSVFVGRSED